MLVLVGLLPQDVEILGPAPAQRVGEPRRVHTSNKFQCPNNLWMQLIAVVWHNAMDECRKLLQRQPTPQGYSCRQ